MSKLYHIALLPGDGIGPEIADQAKLVLDALAPLFDLEFKYSEGLLGGVAIDETGDPFPQETQHLVANCDAVLLAAIGGPKWDTVDPDKPRPEQGLLGLRKSLGAYANLRPVRIFDALSGASPLRPERLEGVDMLIVRELTGGLYFGKRERFYDLEGAGSNGKTGQRAYDTMDYYEYEVERIARVAFDAARTRSQKVHSIDKANVIESSRMWREIVHRVAADYPDIELIDMLVDNTAMQLISRPSQFDVLVMENMFGDILSDEASMLTGSLGMLASASLGDGIGLYEPSHGSAPRIAGQGVANPLAMILSAEMMLRYSFEEFAAADALAQAIDAVLQAGWRTRDIAGEKTPAEQVVGTSAMGNLIAEHLTK
ncbi:MAG: 3-isopropylmalate dehydrogenase [Coriobacteriales bacterium]|jgi:3-isopropylmalate dehydrogenase|nr:3-isopropylmalate dehydrogenase [Coriobacteriales bacterium]